MKFKNLYLTVIEKINLLARWLIVHSIIYYEFDKNVVSDYVFDNNAQQFYNLIKQYPNEFKKSKYYKTMKDFNGNTGFDLYPRLKRFDKKEAELLYQYAQQILYQNERS